MLRIVKPSSDAQRATHTTLDTIEISPNIVRSWKLPPFQRPLRVNSRVMEISREIATNDGVIPGVIVLGVIGGDRYLVDGQHRREAYLLSDAPVGYCDVRILHVKDMAALATEFYKLNSRVVNMRPDDYLRALEMGSPDLARLRRECPFIGFEMIRRGDKAPILSMSAVIRCWWSSGKEVPQAGGCGVTTLADQLLSEECDRLIDFLKLAFAAWGRSPEFYRLWANANLCLCMWMYRRLVISPYSAKTPKVSKDMFQKCLVSLSASDGYLEFLVGRNLTEKSRSPTYNKIKSAFSKRMESETGKRQTLPQPAWASNH